MFSTQFYELAIVITAVIARKRPKEMLPPRRTHPGFWPPPDIAKVLKTFANPTFVSMPNLGSVRNLHTTSVSIRENKCNELHEAKILWVYVAKRQWPVEKEFVGQFDHESAITQTSWMAEEGTKLSIQKAQN